MTLIPKKNEVYKDVEYWNKRYELEENNDWLLHYDSLSHLITQYVKFTDKILMLGCGNSLLSERMFKEGFNDITNIDYSNVVIDKMKNHCATCSEMKWLCMDAKGLKFPDKDFDVVIEKATIDSMMVKEKDPWNISQLTANDIDLVLSEVSRVLKNGGRFVSITFAQPHFRGPLYNKSKFKWSFDKWELGNDFHYYFYVMTKGQSSSKEIFTYTPPVYTEINSKTSFETEATEDNFLFMIEGC
ncbi:EEF1A lysine methyltransferase 4-like [Centruroides vittatus]|uniref:EEF1A lysine methyltransferase 4-like n=1 Tax=Centruroides vittatus TaxID=120091 RepID=UPI00350F79C1